ncbi:MAG: tetratricopeptide repeat protein [Candidatus Sericytochromatia bacterium]|nr:tetratricopeptide repeat protein [Candidatus Sericytochromatia bacterium]
MVDRRMKPWELLGLTEDATDAELRRALEASRSRWQRRRDVATTPEARGRAEAALDRLAEVAAGLGAPSPSAPPRTEPLHSGTDLDILAELARQREMARHEQERRHRTPQAGKQAGAPAEQTPPEPTPADKPPPSASEPATPARRPTVSRPRNTGRKPTTPLTWVLPLLAACLVALGLLVRPGPPPNSTTVPASSPEVPEQVQATAPRPSTPPRLPRAIRQPPLSGAPALLADGARSWKQGRHQDALAAFEAAAKAGANPAIADVGRALALIALNRHPEAEKACRRAIRREPRLAAAHYNLAVALHRQGKPQDAAASFRTFLKLAPQDPAAPNARGYIARQVMRHKPLVTR